MKQHITPKQLDELNSVAFVKLEKWKISKGYGGFPYYEDGKLTHGDTISIGQMIEFLKNDRSLLAIYAPEYNIVPKKYAKEDNPNLHHWQVEKNVSESWYCDNLVDALWQAVKEVLNKDE